MLGRQEIVVVANEGILCGQIGWQVILSLEKEIEGAQLPFLIMLGVLFLMGVTTLLKRVSSPKASQRGYRYEHWPWGFVGSMTIILGSMSLNWVLRRHFPQTVPFGNDDVSLVTAVFGGIALIGLLCGGILFFWYTSKNRI